MPRRRPPFRGPPSFQQRRSQHRAETHSPHQDAPPSTAWQGDTAKWYDSLAGERGSDYQQQVVFPGTLRLLGSVAGQRIVDIGCGQGAFARLLAQTGARVTAVDASRDLIERAKRHSREIAFVTGDATRLQSVVQGPFDGAVCILAIQNIDPPEPVFAGCAALLAPKGRLVLVMNHPAFRTPRQSGWGWDEQRRLQFRRVDSYLTPNKIPIQVHPGSQPGLVAWSFHRPLQAYVRALAAAGFAIDALEEWPSHRACQPGPRAKAEDRARDEIPLFLAIRAVLHS
jgi:SAM-dependent methyltransferase